MNVSLGEKWEHFVEGKVKSGDYQTASEVLRDAAIERNAVMIPQTVPNRPMKGPAEATVASTRRLDSSFSTSREIETSRTFSMRA